MIGTTDILLILAVVVVLFGGKKLPELGKGIGEGLHNFKKGLNGPEGGEQAKKIAESKPDDKQDQPPSHD